MDLSFEFFPTKTAQGMQNLLAHANKLSALSPQYFSVTYGAGGSTQARTLDTVAQLRQQSEIAVAPHMSCVDMTQADITQLLDLYQQQGIRQLVCLRGDLPSGTASNGGDFRYACDLVKFIRQYSADYFHIEVAVYPECHPQAHCIREDLQRFKQKVDAGANGAITQYFYNAEAYYQLLEDCVRLKIKVPITPGIMPITNFSQLTRFSTMCGAEIPCWIRKRLESYADDIQSIRAFGLDVVTQLCEQLLDYGAPSLHFYTLNKAEASLEIANRLITSRSATHATA